MRFDLKSLPGIVAPWLVGISIASATTIKLDGSCSYFGETLPAKTDVIVPPDDDISNLIQRIVDVSGLARNFEIRAALVPNAAAVNLGSTRYILYNPSFMTDIAAATQDRWAASGILAHEIGHHLNGDTLQPGGSRPTIELKADYFSGFILQKLGASLEDATAVIEKFAPEAGDVTHPGRHERIASITSGWTTACRGDADCPKEPITEDDRTNNTAAPATTTTEPNAERRKSVIMREAQ
jgi:hypothetical protein